MSGNDFATLLERAVLPSAEVKQIELAPTRSRATKDDDKLKLVSGRTRPIEWESFPRREPKLARERLGPLKSRKPVGKC
jgi:hypothetical protein